MTFSDLNLNKPLLDALSDLGFTEPTPIQEKAFSVAMSGRDVAGIAQTGTGKTLAYLLPCLRQWAFSKEGHPQILVIVPTRELVVQIVEEVEKLTTYMNLKVVGVYGGANINPQMDTLSLGLDVLVATPGRLLDLILKNAVKMKAVKRLVIDEIDEMLSLGFRPQLTRVLDFLPKNRQNLMFSATMTEEIEALMFDFFRTPLIVEAAPTGTPLSNIQQTGYAVPNFNTKVNLLEGILVDPTLTKVLVFVESRKMADLLFERILPQFETELGIIHSNKAQQKRFETVDLFKDGTHRILIATDIIARGLDIAEVSHVINFDTPEVPEDYIHRIGRTGRADKTGIAITFTTEQEEENQANIEALMQMAIPMLPLPEDLEISDVLIPEEKPIFAMKSPVFKVPKKGTVGAAFHEKLAKNKKVNVRVSRAEKMQKKYGKPQKRAPKKR
jgi:ATP-dependent RNA helicase RhlE